MRGIDHQKALCPKCKKVNSILTCTRCGAKIELRNYDGISRCKAYLIAAIALYIPANLLPMMTVLTFNRGTPRTILGGVINLINLKMYPIAMIVFAASIIVPIFKIISLWYIIDNINTLDERKKKKLTKLYRVVHIVGKWSMLDIFVIALLVILVNVEFISQIKAEPAVLYFTAVVILTILASNEVDTRLIWDDKERYE
ncbi:paraquat-inducible protein A [Halobacteriovorax sp. XZX-3]|uniref:paraquat-inducible protein A n=1 Tax=unclassified Halobacteriovorax TaxID=2639665 RepID=UPI0037216ED9